MEALVILMKRVEYALKSMRCNVQDVHDMRWLCIIAYVRIAQEGVQWCLRFFFCYELDFALENLSASANPFLAGLILHFDHDNKQKQTIKGA